MIIAEERKLVKAYGGADLPGSGRGLHIRWKYSRILRDIQDCLPVPGFVYFSPTQRETRTTCRSAPTFIQF